MKTSYGKPTFNSRATTFHQNLINKNDKKKLRREYIFRRKLDFDLPLI